MCEREEECVKEKNRVYAVEKDSWCVCVCVKEECV